MEEKKKLTSEENELLMAYMLNNQAEKTFNISEISYIIKSLTVQEQIECQEDMRDFKGTQLLWSQNLRVKMLSRALKNFGEKIFETPEKAEAFIRDAGDELVNKIAEDQISFQEEIKELLKRSSDFS